MMNLILEFYKGKTGKVLDLTYGAGTFWKHKPKGWELTAIDEVPLEGFVIKMKWEEIDKLKPNLYDVIVFDPPYTLGSDGSDLIQAKGYSRMKGNFASITNYMKNGTGRMPLWLQDKVIGLSGPRGIIVFKSTKLKSLENLRNYDYLIQDLGYQPQIHTHNRPLARCNHAFWMIFTKSSYAIPRRIR